MRSMPWPPTRHSSRHWQPARARGKGTTLTPHPLEAARLLGTGHRRRCRRTVLWAAERLADRFGCVVVLKGSGSVIAVPGQSPTINPTGNARWPRPARAMCLQA